MQAHTVPFAGGYMKGHGWKNGMVWLAFFKL